VSYSTKARSRLMTGEKVRRRSGCNSSGADVATDWKLTNALTTIGGEPSPHFQGGGSTRPHWHGEYNRSVSVGRQVIVRPDSVVCLSFIWPAGNQSWPACVLRVIRHHSGPFRSKSQVQCLRRKPERPVAGRQLAQRAAPQLESRAVCARRM